MCGCKEKKNKTIDNTEIIEENYYYLLEIQMASKCYSHPLLVLQTILSYKKHIPPLILIDMAKRIELKLGLPATLFLNLPNKRINFFRGWKYENYSVSL